MKLRTSISLLMECTFLLRGSSGKKRLKQVAQCPSATRHRVLPVTAPGQASHMRARLVMTSSTSPAALLLATPFLTLLPTDKPAIQAMRFHARKQRARTCLAAADGHLAASRRLRAPVRTASLS